MAIKLHITCKQATEYVIKREEGKLPLKKHVLLWLHTGICGLCKLFSKQSRFISKNAAHLHEHIEDTLTQTDKEKIITGLKNL
jgi:hypothetical protein